MIGTRPDEAGEIGPRVRELRRDYEARFRGLIDDYLYRLTSIGIT